MSEEVKINEENQYSFENPEYRKTYWHTCSHVLAQALSLIHIYSVPDHLHQGAQYSALHERLRCV